MSTSNTRFVINLNPSNTRSPVWLRSVRESDWSAHGPVVATTDDRSEAAHFHDFYTARDASNAAIGWPDSRVEEIEIAPPSTPAEIEAECVAQEAAEDTELAARRAVIEEQDKARWAAEDAAIAAREESEAQIAAARLHHAEECLYAINLGNKSHREALAKFGALTQASGDAHGRSSRLRKQVLKTGLGRADLRRAEIIAEALKDAAAAALAAVKRFEAAADPVIF